MKIKTKHQYNIKIIGIISEYFKFRNPNDNVSEMTFFANRPTV